MTKWNLQRIIGFFSRSNKHLSRLTIDSILLFSYVPDIYIYIDLHTHFVAVIQSNQYVHDESELSAARRLSDTMGAIDGTEWVICEEKKRINHWLSPCLLLEGTASCQSPLLLHAKTTTSSNTERLGPSFNTWCPSTSDVEPSFQVTLSNITYITAIEIKSFSSDLDYRLEYTRENRIEPNTLWRSYRSLNKQQDRIQLDPPMIARHVRLNLKPNNKNVCLQFELFGCIFTDGVVSYSMLQGSKQLEDDTYDGQYDEKQHFLYGKATSLFCHAETRVSSNVNSLLQDGLGQLSDGQTGPDNREDARGFQWVSEADARACCS